MPFPKPGGGEDIQPASLALPSYLAAYLRQARTPIIPACPPPETLQDPHPRPIESVTTRFVRAMRDFLHAPSTIDTYRTRPADFTRKPCLDFPRLAITLLSGRAKAAQRRLLDLFDKGAFRGRSKCPTGSAFSQARGKIQPAFFRNWAEYAVHFFYANHSCDGFAATWHGRYLWAIDCTTMTLPDTPETRARFGIHENQHPERGIVQAQASFLYDVLNEFPVHAEMGPQQAEKHYLLNGHAQYLTSAVVSLYDRGYADYAVVAALTALPGDFVIRVPLRSTFKTVVNFATSDATDAIVTIPVTEKQETLVTAHNLPREVTVRLVKVTKPGGNVAVLMTSLTDPQQYPAADFQQLYDQRWGVESGFNHFKHQLEVECFSSEKLANIEQDFYGAVVLQVFEAVLNRVEDSAIRAISKCKHLTYEYKVKKADAAEWLSTHLVRLFLSPPKTLKRSLATYQNNLHLQTNPIRPGRHFPRPKLTASHRLHFQMYQKKRR
jgi:hypothetical protein